MSTEEENNNLEINKELASNNCQEKSRENLTKKLSCNDVSKEEENYEDSSVNNEKEASDEEDKEASDKEASNNEASDEEASNNEASEEEINEKKDNEKASEEENENENDNCTDNCQEESRKNLTKNDACGISVDKNEIVENICENDEKNIASDKNETKKRGRKKITDKINEVFPSKVIDPSVYCKLCNLNCLTKKKYSKHLMTEMHYNNINKIEIEQLNIIKPNTNTINEKSKKDPYLNKDDEKDINGIGSGITLIFKNNKKKTKLKFDDNKNDMSCSMSDSSNSNPSSDVENNNTVEHNSEHTSARRTKILEFIKKINKTANYETKFIQLLNKIQLTDMKGLTCSIISYEGITVLERQKFVKLINSFKTSLKNKQEKENQTTYNNMPIKDILAFL